MDVSAPARPHSQARPTQAYYVPRKLLECGRGPQAAKNPTDEKHIRNSHSPPENGHRQILEPREPPRPLMSQIIPKPEHLVIQSKRRSPQQNPVSNGRSHKKGSAHVRISPEPTSGVRRVTPEPAKSPVAAPVKPQAPIVRPNPFCTLPTPPKDVCICNRPEGHIICKRCGYECTGRVQVVCSSHPKKLSLMDLRECPNPLCRSIQILESTTTINTSQEDDS